MDVAAIKLARPGWVWRRECHLVDFAYFRQVLHGIVPKTAHTVLRTIATWQSLTFDLDQGWPRRPTRGLPCTRASTRGSRS